MPRSQPATYDAHETKRMHELHGRPLAPFRRRAAAFLVDLAIGAALFLALFAGWAILQRGQARLRITTTEGRATEPHAPDVNLELKFFSNWYSVIWWVLYFGLATYLGDGRTPGKRLLGIRVVSLVHARLGWWHSLERALGYGASALEFGFGFIQYFIHPNRRTVHDRIAETIVVTDR